MQKDIPGTHLKSKIIDSIDRQQFIQCYVCSQKYDIVQRVPMISCLSCIDIVCMKCLEVKCQNYKNKGIFNKCNKCPQQMKSVNFKKCLPLINFLQIYQNIKIKESSYRQTFQLLTEQVNSKNKINQQNKKLKDFASTLANKIKSLEDQVNNYKSQIVNYKATIRRDQIRIEQLTLVIEDLKQQVKAKRHKNVNQLKFLLNNNKSAQILNVRYPQKQDSHRLLKKKRNFYIADLNRQKKQKLQLVSKKQQFYPAKVQIQQKQQQRHLYFCEKCYRQIENQDYTINKCSGLILCKICQMNIGQEQQYKDELNVLQQNLTQKYEKKPQSAEQIKLNYMNKVIQALNSLPQKQKANRKEEVHNSFVQKQ